MLPPPRAWRSASRELRHGGNLVSRNQGSGESPFVFYIKFSTYGVKSTFLNVLAQNQASSFRGTNFAT